MKRFIRRWVVAFVSVLTVAGLGFIPLAAQNNNTAVGGNGFRISPVRGEFTIEKGKSTVLTVTVENPTDLTTGVKPKITDFVASNNESGETRPILDDTTPKPRNSFTDLVQPIPGFELGPREKKNIQVSISVPENAHAGGYYGVILFEPTGVNKDGNVALTASTGPIVLVRVPGNLTERLDLVQLTASQNDNAKSFLTSGDVSVMVRLKNSGDIHVKPFGRVEVKDIFGRTVANYELNKVEPRANILPDSTRRFVDKLPSRRWIGRYTISANLGYSEGSGNLIGAKTTFWYIPTAVLYLIVIALLLLTSLIYWQVRRMKARRHQAHALNKKK